MELNCFKRTIGQNGGLSLVTGSGGICRQAGAAASFARAILGRYVPLEDYDLPSAAFVDPFLYGQGREGDALALSVNILLTLNHFRKLSFAQAYEKRYYNLLCRQCTQILSGLERGRWITGLADRRQKLAAVEELREYFREIRREAEVKEAGDGRAEEAEAKEAGDSRAKEAEAKEAGDGQAEDSRAKEAAVKEAGDGRAKEAVEERRLERERRFYQLLAEAGNRGHKGGVGENPRKDTQNHLPQNQQEYSWEYPRQNQREFPYRAKGPGTGRGKHSILSWKSLRAKQFFWRVQRAPAKERQLVLAASGTKTVVGLMNVLKTVKESQWAEYGAALWEQVKITAEDPEFLLSISRETADPGRDSRRNALKAEEDPGSGVTADGKTGGAVADITKAGKALTLHLRRWIKENYRETEDEEEILAQKEGLIARLYEEWAMIGDILRKSWEIEKNAEEEKEEEYRQTRKVLAGSKVLAAYGLPVLRETFPKQERGSFGEYNWLEYWPELTLIRPVLADYIRQMESGEWKDRIRTLEKVLEPETYVISLEDMQTLFFAGNTDREKFACLYQQFQEKSLAVRLRHWIEETYRETENEEEILAQKEELIYQLHKGRKALTERKVLAALGFPVLSEPLSVRERDGFGEYGLPEPEMPGPVFAAYIRQMDAGEWKDRVKALKKTLGQEMQEVSSLEDVQSLFFAKNSGRETFIRLYRQFRENAEGEKGQNGQFPVTRPGEVREWYQAVMEAVSYLGESEWNGLKEELSVSREEVSGAVPLFWRLSGDKGDIREEKRTFIRELNRQMAEETELIRQMAEETELIRQIGEETELIRQIGEVTEFNRQAGEEIGLNRQMAEETGLFGRLDGAGSDGPGKSRKPREWIKDFSQNLMIHLRRWLRENPEDPQNTESEAGEKARGMAGDGELRASRIGRRETGDEETGGQRIGSRETGDEETGSQRIGSRETGDEETGSQRIGSRETDHGETGSREGNGAANIERQQQSLLALLKDEVFYFVQEFPYDALEIQEIVSPVIRQMEAIKDLDEQEWPVFKQALSAAVEKPLPAVSSFQRRFEEKAEIREEKRLLIQSLIRQISFRWAEEAFKEKQQEIFRESDREGAVETGKNAPEEVKTVQAELIREKSMESFARLQRWLEENNRETDDEQEIELQKEHLLTLLEHEVRYYYQIPEKDGKWRKTSGEIEESRETYGISREPGQFPLSQPFKARDRFRREGEEDLPESRDWPVYEMLPAPFVYFVRQMQAGEWHKWKQGVGTFLKKEEPFMETVRDIVSLPDPGGRYENITETISRLDEGGWKALKQGLSALSAPGEDVPLQAEPPLLRFLAEKADMEEEKRTFIQAVARQMTKEKELSRRELFLAGNPGQETGNQKQKARIQEQKAGMAADRLGGIRESLLEIAGMYGGQAQDERRRIVFPLDGRDQEIGIFPSVRWLKQENGGHAGYSGKGMRERALNVIEAIREERIRQLPYGEENPFHHTEAVQGGNSFPYHSAAMVVAENSKGKPNPQEGLSGQKKPGDLSADIVRQVREETDIRFAAREQKAGESGQESVRAEMEKALKRLEEQQKELEGKLLANSPEKLSKAVMKKLQSQLRIDRMRHGM